MNPPQSQLLKTLESELKATACTSKLSEEARKLLASVGVKRHYRPGEVIWATGDPGEYVALIASGLVEVSRHSGTDDEMVLGIFGMCDVIGISAVAKKTAYPGQARALTSDCQIIKLYLRTIWNEKTEVNHELHVWLREMMLLHEQVLRDKIDILHAGSVEQRILEFIKHLLRRFGRREPGTRYLIPLRITRTQTARIINARVETTIRVIAKLQRMKVLRWTPRGIQVGDLSLLEKTSNRMEG